MVDQKGIDRDLRIARAYAEEEDAPTVASITEELLDDARYAGGIDREIEAVGREAPEFVAGALSGKDGSRPESLGELEP